MSGEVMSIPLIERTAFRALEEDIEAPLNPTEQRVQEAVAPLLRNHAQNPAAQPLLGREIAPVNTQLNPTTRIVAKAAMVIFSPVILFLGFLAVLLGSAYVAVSSNESVEKIDRVIAKLEKGFNVVWNRNNAPLPSKELILKWAEKFEQNYPKKRYPKLWEERHPINKQFIHAITGSTEEISTLNRFLSRLKEMKDFRNSRTRPNTVLKIDRMIQGIAKNSEFRNEVFVLLQQANETCEDRITVAFNKIELAWHFHCAKLEPKEYAKVLLGKERLKQMEKIVDEISANPPPELGFIHEVEVMLYFQIKLNEDLGLSISTKDMVHPYNAAWITDAMLKDAKERILAKTGGERAIELLAHSQNWIACLEKSHSERIQGAKDRFLASDQDYADVARYKDEIKQLTREILA